MNEKERGHDDVLFLCSVVAGWGGGKKASVDWSRSSRGIYVIMTVRPRFICCLEASAFLPERTKAGPSSCKDLSRERGSLSLFFALPLLAFLAFSRAPEPSTCAYVPLTYMYMIIRCIGTCLAASLLEHNVAWLSVAKFCITNSFSSEPNKARRKDLDLSLWLSPTTHHSSPLLPPRPQRPRTT